MLMYSYIIAQSPASARAQGIIRAPLAPHVPTGLRDRIVSAAGLIRALGMVLAGIIREKSVCVKYVCHVTICEK